MPVERKERKEVTMGLIKVCGITRIADALAAAEAGFDAVGLVFAESPRRVDPRTARKICSCLPPTIFRVGVFLGQKQGEIKGLMEYCGLDLAQLHEAPRAGLPEELGNRAVIAMRPRFAGDLKGLDAYRDAFAVLIDAWHPELAGGTGHVCDWGLAARAARAARIILAGGLRPHNVSEAIHRVHPFGVDVSSGVETSPGVKDPTLLKRFARAAREALGSLPYDATVRETFLVEADRGRRCVSAPECASGSAPEGVPDRQRGEHGAEAGNRAGSEEAVQSSFSLPRLMVGGDPGEMRRKRTDPVVEGTEAER